MNWRRIRKRCAILAGIGLVALLVVAWFVGGALVASANRTIGKPPADFPATAVQIESDSGATLAGWHLPIPNSSATAILLHPIRGDRRSMLSRAKLLRAHGYSILLIDLQAHGESVGQHITMGHLEKHDVNAAVEFVRDLDANQKIAIIGSSLGGAATIFANPDVDVIVLESVYPTVTEAVHNRIKMRMGFLHHVVAPLLLVQLNPRLGISPDQLCPIDGLRQIKCPILIASGNRDEHTTMDETNRIFEIANEPKKLVTFDGAEHVDLLAHDPSKYENEIIGYVNRIIGESIRGTE
jgi:uncharacterized protein